MSVRVSCTVLVLFFCAGAASLVHEVTWLKVLANALSGSGRVLAPVLAGFLAGLAVGASWGGRWLARGGRASSPGRCAVAYGLLEGAAALIASTMPLVLPILAGWSAGGTLLPLFACTVAIFVATLPLGATFPFQVLMLRVGIQALARRAGAVLAVQTSGGMVGVLAAGFVLLPNLGIWRTQLLAAAVGLLVAVVAVWIGRRLCSGEVEQATSIAKRERHAASPDPSTDGGESHRVPPMLAGAWIGAAAIGGACSLALEVVQTRVLIFFLPDLAWSFSAMLAMYLLALAAGSAVVAVGKSGRWLQHGTPGAATALAAVLVVLSISQIDDLAAMVRGHEATTGGFVGTGTFLWTASLASLRLVGPPAFVLGMVLPVCATLFARRGVEARRVGWVYAANTLGSAAGALLGGLVLIGAFGLRGSLVTIALVLVAVSLWNLLASGGGWRSWAVSAPLLLVAVIGGVRCDRGPVIADSRVMQSNRALANERKLLDAREGNVASVAVVEDRTGRFLFTDSFQAAGTGDNYRYMRMLAHLPALLAPKLERSVVIAFGTGTTAGALTLHQRLQRLDLVELAPEVFELAPHFHEVNRGLPGTSPDHCEVHAIVDDGRAFLRRTRDPYDLVTLEPLLPVTPAAAHFYTTDFFALARERLVEGGLLCHWIPVHAQSLDLLRAMLRAFADEFEEGELYVFGSSLVLLGWNGRPTLESAVVEKRMAAEELATDMQAAGVQSVRDLWAAYLCDTATLRQELAEVSPARDDLPAILYPRLRPNHESLRDEVEGFRWLMGIEDEGPPLVDREGDFARRIEIGRRVRAELLGDRLRTLEQRYSELDRVVRSEEQP